jgi:hypothetical protein
MHSATFAFARATVRLMRWLAQRCLSCLPAGRGARSWMKAALSSDRLEIELTPPLDEWEQPTDVEVTDADGPREVAHRRALPRRIGALEGAAAAVIDR